MRTQEEETRFGNILQSVIDKFSDSITGILAKVDLYEELTNDLQFDLNLRLERYCYPELVEYSNKRNESIQEEREALNELFHCAYNCDNGLIHMLSKFNNVNQEDNKLTDCLADVAKYFSKQTDEEATSSIEECYKTYTINTNDYLDNHINEIKKVQNLL